MEDGYYIVQVTPPFHEYLLEKRKKIMEQGASKVLGRTGHFHMKGKNQINASFLIEDEENRSNISKYEMSFRTGQKKITTGFIAADIITINSIGASGEGGPGSGTSTEVDIKRHEWIKGAGDLVVHPDQKERTLDIFNKKVDEFNAMPGTETWNPISSDEEEAVMKNVDQRNQAKELKRKGKPFYAALRL